jgi:hypothetical protein
VVCAIVAQVESTDAFETKRAIHALLAHRRTCIFTLTEDEARALFDVVAIGTDGTGSAEGA